MKNRNIKSHKLTRGEKIFVCVLTTINVLASLAVRIYDRKQIVKAVQNPETFKTVVVEEKTTKEL